MNILFAILAGIIQGITEFLPVSSSALTAMFSEQLAFTDVPPLLFSSALHLGTLAAALWVLRRSFFKLFESYGTILKDIFGNLRTWYRNTRFEENGSYARIFSNVSRTLAGMVLTATIPGMVIGFALRHAAEDESIAMLVSGMGFLATAILLLVAALIPASARMGRDLTMRKSFLVGILQGFAVLPGVSRCGMVYASSQVLGMHRKTAARYALLTVLPIAFGAILYELTIGLETVALDSTMILELVAGGAAAWLTGSRMIKFCTRVMRKNCLRLFCIINCIFGLICVISYASA